MTLADIKQEAQHLSPAEKRDLFTWLAAQSGTEPVAEMTAMLDDPAPERWVRGEQLWSELNRRDARTLRTPDGGGGF